MKKVTKETLIKKNNKISQLKKEKEVLESNIDNLNKEICNKNQILEDCKMEYNQLVSSNFPLEVKAYPFDVLIRNLNYYPKRIKKLNAIKRKTIKKRLKIQDKINKLSKLR